MKLRSLIVTVAVLAVLSALVFLARRPEAPAASDPRVGQPLADPALLEKAAQIRLNDSTKSLVVTRTAEGGWKIPGYFDLPADFTKVSGFASSLTDAKIDRLVTTSPERIARLDFKDTHIALLDASGKEFWQVTLGKNTDTGGRYVRFGEEPKAYLVTTNLWLDLEAKNWADTRLLEIKPDDVAKIEVSFVDGPPMALSRTKKDQPWTSDPTPAGLRVKADKVAALLSSVGTIRFLDTNDPSDPDVVAAKANARTVKFTTFEGKTVSVALGRKPEVKKLKSPAGETKTAQAAASPTPEPPKASGKPPGAEKPTVTEKPAVPEIETIPAGPVFVFIGDSDPQAAVNKFMQSRGFQVSEYEFNGLPQKPAELFEPLPPVPEPKDAGPKKP